MTPLAAYLLLFVAVGIGFIFVHLMAGKFIRPSKPDPAKRTIYECGEPTIGSAWIQFDLRFYVIALLFVIFDVEVAFFFPWAVVFGKANSLVAQGEPKSADDYHRIAEQTWDLLPPAARSEHAGQYKRVLALTPAELDRLHELREAKRKAGGKSLSPQEETELVYLSHSENFALETVKQARSFSWLALLEIAVFFGVLLVGFAYLWSRGDLAWVRSLAAERSSSEPGPRFPSQPTSQPGSGALAGTSLPS
jgi:NADH-quinone oxidoreductase subunit A